MDAVTASEAVYQRSETIAQLAGALAKAQGAITSAEKDRTNPHFKQKYATLDAVWEACRAPLSENGLAVMQLPRVDGNRVTLATLLAHASGEWISATLVLMARDATPQSVGSCLTYGKRYGLSAMVGVAPGADEDDDGNAATGDDDRDRRQQQRQEHAASTARVADKLREQKRDAADAGTQPQAPAEPTIPKDGIYTPLQLKHVEKDAAGNPVTFGILTAELGDWMLETKDREVARALVDAKKAGRKVVIEWSTTNGRRTIDQISAAPAQEPAA